VRSELSSDKRWEHMMKPITSTFLASILLTLGLAGCDYGTEETAGVGEEEGIYQEEEAMTEEEGLYEQEQEAEIVEQPGVGTEEETGIVEEETGFGEQEGIAEEEQEADVEIVEEGEELDLPEESPAAGEEEQQPIQ
jgi:hypothetical protein